MADNRQSAISSDTGFPPDFAWGTATSAYQIEGAPTADGKGESIWDRFSHTPGKIADASTGDVADDHYARWQDDLDLMSRLNLNAYRFSIAWPRIFPEGHGKPNEAGLDFYERLVEGLLARGIAPFATLYHWDLPQALQERGGWESRDTALYFSDYAEAVARRLGDRVGHWITHNEPAVTLHEGHVQGTHAPGKRDFKLIAPVAHHLLLSHALAAQALRTETPPGTEVGITLNFSALEPASDRAADVEATRVRDGLDHRIFLDPIFNGAYPEDIEPLLQFAPNLVRPADMGTIMIPLDFLGVNYYTRAIIQAGPGGPTDPRAIPPSGDLTTMGWEVYPSGLHATLDRLWQDYAPPKFYMTENGAAFPDEVSETGEVHDPKRVAYLRDHFLQARRALAEGMPLAGYFVWSLLDNFEWALGYRPRFGVVHVDFPTQRRTIKDSGYFLGRLAATNGGSLEE